MPFGLRLKKTRRYNVTSKNSYVARIQLLDNTLLELTLTPESLGQDCLDTIAQRLQLEETMYFGLQYINKGYKLRWVDLEKPLKKQLEKNCQDPILRFCVMLYASNVQQLRQEITRYLYFLQLKSDIIEGILPCSPEQAVLLASYAVQAEFGDFDAQRHNVEFLHEFVLLPKNMTPDSEILCDLIQEVINTFSNHAGISPDTAELAYITEASQLEGYGQENYPAKDEMGNELFLGASSIGIFVKHLNGQPTVTFKWSDIVNMVHNKRLFGIETHNEETLQFQVEDAEAAKYVWRMCKMQQQFYKMCLANTKPAAMEVSLDGNSGFDNKRKLITNSSYRGGSIERRPTLLRHSELNDHVNTNLKDVSSDESIHQTVATDSQAFSQSQLSLDHQWAQDGHGQFTMSQLSLERPPTADHAFANGNLRVTNHNGSIYSVNSANHVLPMQVSPTSSNLSLAGNELLKAQLQAALPAYRPSPDYNPNVHGQHIIMMNHDQSSSMGNLGVVSGYGHMDMMDSRLYQQPELRQRSQTHGNQYRQQYRLSYNGLPNSNPAHFLESAPLHHMMYEPGNHHAAIIHTYSVPELTSHLQTTEEYIAAKLLKNKFRPPPPYPRGSTSTPDLARQNWQNYQVSSSSPDLVSRRLQHMLIHPVHEVHPGMSSSNMSTSSGNIDLTQSLPMEAFQNLHLSGELPRPQDYDMNMYMGQHAFPSSSQHGAPANLVMHNSGSTSPTEVPILQVPVGYEDQGNVFLPDGTYTVDPQSPKQLKDFHIPLMRPPSEFADTSDIDSNISPNSVGSPPRQFKLPGHSKEMYVSTQTAVPEDSIVTYASSFGPVERRRPNSLGVNSIPSGEGLLQQSPSPLSPEMQEINASQFAMQHIDKANLVDASKMQASKRDSGIVETNLTGPPPTSPVYLSPSHLGKRSDGESSDASQSVHTSPDQGAQVTSGYSTSQESEPEESFHGTVVKEKEKNEYMGPLKLAAMSGLTLVRPGEKEDDDYDNPKHPRDARRKILEEHLRDGQVFTEYELIPKRRPGAIFYTAQLPDNEVRNRFKDVLPYEDKRIELAPMHDNSTGYINASNIKISIARETCHYVAAQGPMENTVKDWWRMVWEKGINVIAMLTKVEEGGKDKCFKYWPDCSSSKNTVEFGPFRIIGQFCNDSGCYVTSGLTVRHVPSGEQRTVWHLQYTDWPNQGCPEDIHGYLAFVEEFQSVCRHANSINDKPAPPLVHCSAGVGRTGVLVLTDLMLNSLEHNEEINVPRMLERLRNQRMMMVQTVGQYIFVYRSLIQTLRNTRLI
ncbi:tyrosine-protein phosphatase non-receptor type 21-like [Asterias rubens]|uniref:tyrosine-protein phosphatase non-receptor type 21-like n=1 Tax=Asterias rubens TaxID=7604 RepID=UPI0014553BE8|nr:tyrosine-protein phosphatase non-receptor type 21-like [Asterias rubens]XP_033624618.1 tyrosine-protein phosphatase non-receptor type 21-like [Asterias rubens]XP_033624624.1 tyrosine-protein phosphatase non-receptor type 21-like [Asterias rubens]